MQTVDPDSDEASARREAMSRLSPAEHAARGTARPYALAAALIGVALAMLALARPEWARSYAWLVAALAALPFLHTLFFGVLTDGLVAPRPFGLRPVATVLVATAAFATTAVLAPEVVERLGPSLAGLIVGIVAAALFVRWVLARLFD